MATRDTLFFSGRRWPGVRSTGGVYVERLYQFAFVASGNGQQWEADQPMAFWRNFAAIDLTNDTEALRFIAQHGDPFGYLDIEPTQPNRSPHGTNQPWFALKAALREIAQAWDPLDPNEISFISNDPERLTVAQQALYELARPDKAGLKDIEWIAQGRGLVPRARTLQAFIIASAASALRRGIAMRVCRYCADWFELRRTDAVYCSGSCQAADYKQRSTAPRAVVLETTSYKSKGHHHGKRAQTHSPGSNHLPGRMARKRGRKTSPKK
jgi:hypothetical protein